MSTPRIRFYEYTVEGSHGFPVDMLRYDACWPKGQDDVVTAFGSGGPRGPIEKRSVRLLSTLKAPTVARWYSFGWVVSDIIAIDQGGRGRTVDLTDPRLR